MKAHRMQVKTHVNVLCDQLSEQGALVSIFSCDTQDVSVCSGYSWCFGDVISVLR